MPETSEEATADVTRLQVSRCRQPLSRDQSRVSLAFKSLIAAFLLVWAMLLPSNLANVQLFAKDAQDYSLLATHLVTQHAYTLNGGPYLEREPGYPFFLAIIYGVFGVENRVAIFAVQAFVYLACVLLFVRELSRRSTQVAIIAGAFLLLSPSVFHTIFSVLRENLTLSMFLLFFAALLSYLREPTLLKACSIGLLLGMISITFFSFVFLPLAILVYLACKRNPVPHLILVVLLPCVLVAAWGFRNLVQDGSFRIIGSARAEESWYGRAVQAETLRLWDPPRCLWAAYISQDWQSVPRACSMETLRHEALSLHPNQKATWAAILTHLPSYLWDSAFDGLEYQFPYVGSWGRFYNILAAVETLLLGIGCLLAVPRWKEVIPFGIVLLYGTLFFALNEVVPRYHMPIYCAYAAIAGVGYAGTVRSYFRRKTPSPAAAA